MFSLNEKVVYPGHGVAKINQIVEKIVSGFTTQFFELKFVNKDMTVLVPVNNLKSAGIRRLSSSENIDTVFNVLAEPVGKINPQDLAASNWNKRNKDYQCKLRTGNIREIGKIYRDLKHIATHKELSFGEKNLLSQTESLLVEEISLVKGEKEESTIKQLRELFKDFRKNNELTSPSTNL